MSSPLQNAWLWLNTRTVAGQNAGAAAAAETDVLLIRATSAPQQTGKKKREKEDSPFPDEAKLRSERKISFPVAEILLRRLTNSSKAEVLDVGLGKQLAAKWIRNATSHIFDDPARSILEIIVNGCDAQRPEGEAVGKFGLGFFSFLHFLDYSPTGGATITIETTYLDLGGMYHSYRLLLEKDDKGQLIAHFKHLRTSAEPKTGTSVSLKANNGKFPEALRADFARYVNYLQFYEAGKVISQQEGAAEKSFGFGAEGSDPVQVSIRGTSITVQDYGCGIPLATAFRHLLCPSGSNKGTGDLVAARLSSRVSIPRFVDFEGKQDVKKSSLLVTVGGVLVAEVQLPDNIVGVDGKSVRDFQIAFPLVTELTVARNAILFSPTGDSFEDNHLRQIIDQTIIGVLQSDLDADLLLWLLNALKAWESQDAASHIGGRFSNYFSSQLERALASNRALIPLPPKTSALLLEIISWLEGGQQAAVRYLALPETLADGGYVRLQNRLEMLVKARTELGASAWCSHMVRAGWSEGLVVGMKVLFCPDALLGENGLSMLGLRGRLFVPYSYLERAEKDYAARSLEEGQVRLAQRICEAFSSTAIIIFPSAVPGVNEGGEFVAVSQQPQLMITNSSRLDSTSREGVMFMPNWRKEGESERSRTLDEFAKVKVKGGNLEMLYRAFYDKFARVLFALSIGKGRDLLKITTPERLLRKKITDCLKYQPEKKATVESNGGTYDTKKEISWRNQSICTDTVVVEGGVHYFIDEPRLTEVGLSLVGERSEAEILALDAQQIEDCLRQAKELGEWESWYPTRLENHQLVHICFVRLMSHLFDPRTGFEGAMVAVGEQILWPLPEDASLEDFERLFFTLVSGVMYPSDSGDVLKQAATLSLPAHEIVERGNNTPLYEEARLQPKLLPLIQELLRKVDFLRAKAKLCNQIFPGLEGRTISQCMILSKLTIMVRDSGRFTASQKESMEDLLEFLLHLYDRFLTFSEEELVFNYATAGSSEVKMDEGYCYSSDGELSDILYVLEAVADSPALWEKLLHFMKCDLQFQLDPLKRANDLRSGKKLYLPSITTNTPFSVLGLLATSRHWAAHPSTLFSMLVRVCRSPEELHFVAYSFSSCHKILKYLRPEKDAPLPDEEAWRPVIERVEEFVRFIVQEKIDSDVVKAIYQEARLQWSHFFREPLIDATGAPDLLTQLVCNSGSGVIATSLSYATNFLPPKFKASLDAAPSCCLSHWISYLLVEPQQLARLVPGEAGGVIAAAIKEARPLELGKITQAVECGSERDPLEAAGCEMFQNAADRCLEFMESVQDGGEQASIQARLEAGVAKTKETVIESLTKVRFHLSLLSSTLEGAASPCLQVCDPIGFPNLKTLLTDYLIADFTHKEGKANLIGQLGNGMFQVYKDALRVTVMTRLTDDPAYTYLLSITPSRNPSGVVDELVWRVSDVSLLAAEEKFFGTRIRIHFRPREEARTRAEVLYASHYIRQIVDNLLMPLPGGKVLTCHLENDGKEPKEKKAPTLLAVSPSGIRVYAMENKHSTSSATTRGVPFLPLHKLVKQLRILPKAWEKRLFSGYTVDLPPTSFQPTQSRTHIQLSPKIEKELQQVLLNAYMKQTLKKTSQKKDAQKRDHAFASLFPHMGSTCGSFSQLKLYDYPPDEIARLLEDDPTDQSLFTYFSPDFLSGCRYHNFQRWIDYGYKSLVKEIHTEQSRYFREFDGWVEKARGRLTSPLRRFMAMATRRDQSLDLLKEYGVCERAYRTKVTKIFKAWHKELVSDAFVRSCFPGEVSKDDFNWCSDFLKVIVGPWFGNKVGQVKGPVRGADGLFKLIPELKGESLPEAEERERAEIAPYLLQLQGEYKGVAVAMLELARWGLESYSKLYLERVGGLREGFQLQLTYAPNNNFGMMARHKGQQVLINTDAFSVCEMVDLVLAGATGAAIQNKRAFDRMMLIGPLYPGFLHHELEHVRRKEACSSTGRNGAHAPDYDREGRWVHFHATTASYARHAIQSGLLEAWRGTLAEKFAEMKLDLEVSQECLQLMEKIARQYNKYLMKALGIPVKKYAHAS